MMAVSGLFGKAGFSEQQTKGDQPTISKWASSLTQPIKQLIKQSIVINSTAFEGEENG